MTTLFDPLRPRIGNMPALLAGKSGFAVPRLSLWPDENNPARTTLSCMIPVEDEGYTARQVSATIDTADLHETVQSFRADPEKFLETLFHLSLPPRAKQPGPLVSSSSEGI